MEHAEPVTAWKCDDTVCAALMMFILAITGVLLCVTSSYFMRRYKYIED